MSLAGLTPFFRFLIQLPLVGNPCKMNHLTKYRENGRIWLITTCLFFLASVVLFLYLQHSQAFIYYYREQHQIFLMDQAYCMNLLKPIGGFAVLVSQWLIQFFVLPYMGAIITTLLCLISAVFFFLPFYRFVKYSWLILPLTFFPSVLYSLSLTDVSVPYEGLVAIVLVSIFLWLFSLLWKSRWYIKLIGGVMLFLPLYYLVGSVSFVFPKQNNPAFYALLKQIHYADTEEWDLLLKVEDINASNDVQMNYLNLALSHQGLLLERLFAYQQKDVGSLITRETNYTDVSVLLSRIYYHIGAIGAAQNQAFSSMVGITYGNPSMAKLLVKTYLISGFYALAEKQIKMLEKTWYYADWAREQRRFLYNDADVENDLEFGAKRRNLASKDRFTMLYGPMDDLVSILNINPDNCVASEYLLSMLLVSKDVNDINAFINQFAGKGCLATIPQRLQEAMVIINERDPAFCREHGVSEETMQAFAEFRQTYMTLRSQGRDLRALAPQYGRTFWYHLIR